MNSDEMVHELAQHLLQRGFDEIPARERRVIERVARRVQVSRNVNREFADSRTFGEWLADRVATFGGSWTFILLFAAFMVLWAILNTNVLRREAFDPYPYVFLNLILSMLAAVQAPIIMMSQNRQAARDRLAAASDYEINLKAELEVASLHDKIDHLSRDHLNQILALQRENGDLLRAIFSSREGERRDG